MIEILLSIIIFPFAAMSVVFTGALGVSIIKSWYSAILRIKK